MKNKIKKTPLVFNSTLFSSVKSVVETSIKKYFIVSTGSVKVGEGKGLIDWLAH